MVKLMPRVYTRATCYLCARPLDGDSTSEHVVSRQLYPSSPLPNDMLTLPAHGACNKSTQPDEDVFRDFVAAGIPEGSPAMPLWETTWRGLNREPAAGKKGAFFAGLVERDDLLHVTIDEPRANWVLAKMVKA